MWMSVPQIAVFFMRISTSFGPIVGRATSAIQMPGSAFALTSAFMPAAPAMNSIASFKHAEFASRGRERGHRALELRARVGRRQLGADARLADRHDRERESDDVDAEFEQPVGHAAREPGVADHDRHDRML